MKHSYDCIQCWQNLGMIGWVRFTQHYCMKLEEWYTEQLQDVYGRTVKYLIWRGNFKTWAEQILPKIRGGLCTMWILLPKLCIHSSVCLSVILSVNPHILYQVDFIDFRRSSHRRGKYVCNCTYISHFLHSVYSNCCTSFIVFWYIWFVKTLCDTNSNLKLMYT